ncbi:GGDEF domain-containing protein [Tumebacillus sp. ITR2]|uniref:GGDEF domain-containing protein n=1 Tax=Tumebacillus amylolyticus TaxID=2801339 RepID=A0ABS1J8R5_9BACL|nr:GGDEF domain-containing protein [Tumebacillus amylolyticus]MBL0386667.1 GGDEF domain-containing protein [Tumebacillus amylolyticus]
MFFLHQVFKDRNVTPTDKLYKRINFGLVQGVLGWLLMHYSLQLGGGVVFDLRMIPIFLAAATGGWAAALAAAFAEALGRIILFSWTPATMVATVTLTLTAIVSGSITRWVSNAPRSWMYMVFANLIVVCVGSIYAVPDSHLRLLIMLQYALVLSIASLFTYLLVHRLTSSHEMFVKIRDSARVDFLTGLNNVRSFDEAINSLLQKNMDYGENLSFLMIDIDHFKKVNDTYGHPAGDEVLKQLGELLTHTSRGRDIVSRNGGEEFSVILPGCSRENALHVAERLRAVIARHPFQLPDDQVIKVTVSLGLAVSTPDVPLTVDELVHLADEGLYRAKRTGRNRVCEFQPLEG